MPRVGLYLYKIAGQYFIVIIIILKQGGGANILQTILIAGNKEGLAGREVYCTTTCNKMPLFASSSLPFLCREHTFFFKHLDTSEIRPLKNTRTSTARPRHLKHKKHTSSNWNWNWAESGSAIIRVSVRVLLYE